MPKNKPKIAVYWAASCGGCDVSVLGLHERILDLVEFADIAFWPAAADLKYDDLRKYSEDEIDLTLFNGAIRSSENEEIAKILREKSRTLVSYGSCAAQGGIPGLANLASREEIYDTVYRNNETTPNPDAVVPQNSVELNGREMELPSFYDRVKSLSQVVEVDYTVPGCPPPPEIAERLLDLVLEGDLPEPGSVIAESKTVCDECSREWRKETVEEFVRPHQAEIDPEECLLDQGIICMGPATRAGCGASCPSAQMPCAGCFGPPPNVTDQGTKMLNSLASILKIGEEGDHLDQEQDLLETLPDPIGSFYQYSLPSSIFGGRVDKVRDDE